MPGAVRVTGLGDLVRAFHKMPDVVKEDMVWELEEAANPVKLAAQAKAPTTMSGMGKPTQSNRAWSAMRVGITRRNPANVYVVPQLRGGTRRSSEKQKEKFTVNMQGRALDPALAQNEGKVEERIEDFLDRLGRKNGF